MSDNSIQFAVRALDDPERLTNLKAAFQHHVANLLAEANDAGYSEEEAVMSLLGVVENAMADRRQSEATAP